MTTAFSFRQQSIINGSLLGDGNLSKIRYKNGNSYFSKPQKAARREYLEWHLSELQPFSSSVGECENFCKGKSYRRAYFSTKVSPIFTELREKWYPEGKKIVPRDLVLDPLAIAIWFFDDGSNDVGARTCTFATYSFDKDDCDFLVSQLNRFSLQCYVGDRNRIKTRSGSYKEFVDLIRPYMLWPFFEHKIRYRDAEFEPTTDTEGRKMFELYEAGRTQTEIAAELGKSLSVVSNVLRGVRLGYLGLSKVDSGLSIKNTSGVKNVAWDKRREKWAVSLKRNGKSINLGRFAGKDDAIKALEKFTKGDICSNC